MHDVKTLEKTKDVILQDFDSILISVLVKSICILGSEFVYPIGFSFKSKVFTVWVHFFYDLYFHVFMGMSYRVKV